MNKIRNLWCRLFHREHHCYFDLCYDDYCRCEKCGQTHGGKHHE